MGDHKNTSQGLLCSISLTSRRYISTSCIVSRSSYYEFFFSLWCIYSDLSNIFSYSLEKKREKLIFINGHLCRWSFTQHALLKGILIKLAVESKLEIPIDEGLKKCSSTSKKLSSYHIRVRNAIKKPANCILA